MKRRTLLQSLLSIAPAAALRAAKTVSDDQLYDNVKRKLANDPVVKGGALDVDVKAGSVTLRGKVETPKQKERAEKLVRKLAGVKNVVNEITVQARTAR